MTANSNPPAKPKFRRACGPKARTGCITWYDPSKTPHLMTDKDPSSKTRHFKCDEGKPTCRRCVDDKCKCDGYAMPKPKKERKRRRLKAAMQPVAQLTASVSEVSFLTEYERLYFHHFLQWTKKQLSVSPESTNLWLRYALPMAHRSGPIWYSMIAVGASHRVFMARSVGYSHPWELKGLAIRQYKKAISSILPTMSVKTTSNMHCILVCRLLFISLEGLTGRYDELLRHLLFGNELFYSPLPTSTPEERAVSEKLAEMFCRVGVESSSFMHEHSLEGVSQWYRGNSTQSTSSSLPFQDLDEASFELRQLDLRQTDKPWQENDSEEGSAEGEDDSRPSIKDALHEWSLRLEASSQLKEAALSTEAASQLRNLRLRQQFWQMTIDEFSSEDAPSSPQAFAPFLAAAETVAVPFIAMNQPTFSPDGDLISDISFVASLTQDNGIKSKSLALLRQLNRREGIWDSHDVVEMHELMMNVDTAKAYEPSSEESADWDTWDYSTTTEGTAVRRGA